MKKNNHLLIVLLSFGLSAQANAQVLEHRLVEILNISGINAGLLLKGECKKCQDKFYIIAKDVQIAAPTGKRLSTDDNLLRKNRLFDATIVINKTKRKDIVESILIHNIVK